jgi:hypothetical protein
MVWHIRDFSDGDCYYYEFKHGDAFDVFPIDSLIPADDLNRIKNKEIRLVVCNCHEAFHSVVLGLYTSLVINHNIPTEQITLISESADILLEVNRVSALFNKNAIKVEWIRVFESSIQREKLHLIQTAPKRPVIENKIYSKKFLNFNRRWRLHRPTLVALMHINNLLDKGHVSLGASDDFKTWNSAWPEIRHMFANNFELNSMFIENEQKILAIPPLYLDSPDLVNNKANLEHSTTNLYEDTYFSVVTETNYFTTSVYDNVVESGRFISEKTFKPIAQCHPFIAVTVPNFLDAVRSVGYETFSPWIDESYDKELDDSKRLLMIVAEIKRLAELTPDEIKEFQAGVRDICTFNLGVLMRKTEFINKLN